MADARNERRRLQRRHPEAYEDGELCGLGKTPEGQRERGGYPKGFHQWPLDKRNAWFAGFNIGYAERKRATAKGPQGRLGMSSVRERGRDRATKASIIRGFAKPLPTQKRDERRLIEAWERRRIGRKPHGGTREDGSP
jgi:hypothetical protein